MISFGAAYFTYWLAGKPRLIAYSPNSAFFSLEPAGHGDLPIAVRAGQIIVQNAGRKSARRVQLLAEAGPKPSGYTVFPNVDHAIKNGPRDEWLMEIPFLGAGETVTVQILNGANIGSIRSEDGPARIVPVMHQRVFPKWFNLTAAALMFVGLATVVATTVLLLFGAVS